MINGLEVDNRALKEKLSSLINDLDYSITYDDIDANSINTLGLYLRAAGNSIGSIGDSPDVHVLDITLRLHGSTEEGSNAKCERDIRKLVNRLTMYNKRLDNVYVVSCVQRGREYKLGVTSKGIPVYNASLLIKFN